MSARVLVVDPQSAANGSRLRSLADGDLDIVVVASGADARAEVEGDPPDVIVLDPTLPDDDGLNLCRWLRVWPGAPIIAVPAAADEQTQLELFAAGVDDVVGKAVSLELLRARIAVQLRHQTPPFASGGEQIVVGALRLDTATFEADIAGRPLELTPALFNLLRVLAHNVGVVVAPRVIARAIGQTGDRDHGNAIRIGISRLRQRLGTGPDIPRIVNEPKVGYRLVPPGPD